MPGARAGTECGLPRAAPASAQGPAGSEVLDGVTSHLRQRMESTLGPLFTRTTDQCLDVLWHRESSAAERGRWALCPKVRGHPSSRGTLPTACQRCACSCPPHTLPSLEPTCPVHGICGALHFGAVLRVDNEILAHLVFQTRRATKEHPSPAASVLGVAQALLQLILHDLQETASHWCLAASYPGTSSPGQPGQPLKSAPAPLPKPCPGHAYATPSETIVRMLDYVAEGSSRPVCLKEFAGRIGRNPSYLSDLFARSVGCSFRERLNALRRSKAEGLLADQGRSVQEIARAVGFADPHEFRWAFKRWTGRSPTAWRARRSTEVRGESQRRRRSS